MTKFQAARDLIRNADSLLIVNDGMFRWVGDKAQITKWLERHDYSTRKNALHMNSDDYQDLCDSTTCESDRVATVGDGDLVRLCQILEEKCGVDELWLLG
jgi:hypothetical protein